MSQQYAKLKNDELQGLLKKRGLPATGKKADMVDRLIKDDEKASAETAPSKVHPEDEIDFDDEDAKAQDTAAKDPGVAANSETVAKAGGTEQPLKSQAVPNQKSDIDPSKTDDLSVKAPGEEGDNTEANPEEPQEPAPSYAAGVAATDLDAEIEKRKKRAEKFGLKVEDDETLKKLERAKKFGSSGTIGALDEALPERERKERKRGREDSEDAGRNKRRGGARGGGNRGARDGRDGRDGRGGNRDGDRRRDHRDNRRDDRRNDQSTGWMTKEDRERADARKAKWAANS